MNLKSTYGASVDYIVPMQLRTGIERSIKPIHLHTLHEICIVEADLLSSTVYVRVIRVFFRKVPNIDTLAIGAVVGWSVTAYSSMYRQ